MNTINTVPTQADIEAYHNNFSRSFQDNLVLSNPICEFPDGCKNPVLGESVNGFYWYYCKKHMYAIVKDLE